MSDDFNTSKMDNNIDMLEARIIDCLDNTDFDSIFKAFQDLKEPTLFIGSGGSSVAAKFIASIINEKNEIISEPKTPDEVWVSKITGYKKMIIVSSGGMNYGAKKAYEKGLDNGLTVITMSGSSRVTDEGNIKYTKTIKSEDSFISFAETLLPMIIALTYYIGDVEKSKKFVKSAFQLMRKNKINYPISENYEILGKDRFPTAAAFVESAMNESGIAIPTISGTYDELHGRTTSILQEKDRQLVYLLPVQQTEIDEFLHERLNECGIGDRITDVPAFYDDYILDDFYLTLQMISLCTSVAHEKGVDLSTMSDSNGRRHIPANNKAIEAWEAKNPGQSFWDVCDFRGLRSLALDLPEKSPGYYGPTGKFAEPDFGSEGRRKR